MRGTPVTCSPDTSIRSALQTMHDAHLGSMIVTDDTHRPLGIFTLRDLLERVVLADLPIDQPISRVMSEHPVTLPPGALAYEAAMVMAGAGFRHVLVTEHDGTLRGIVSERDLFSLQRVGLHQLSTAIRQAASVDVLIALSGDIRELTHNMMAQGVAAEQITQLISTLNDLLTSRIIELELHASPEIDFDFCWIALGSEGRLEQTLNTDQDNGIIFDLKQGQDANRLRELMLPFARRINLDLAECGFPLCNGEVMASNPKWCLSLAEWKTTFTNWIDHGDPMALLYATIFFDFRPLFGARQLAVDLRTWLSQAARKNSRFLHQLGSNAMRNAPPLGVVRDFVTGDGHTLDLKLNGITPFVDAARIFSLAHGATQTNTVGRLRQLAELNILRKQDAAAWIDAFLFIQLLRLRLHYEQFKNKVALTNKVDPDTLNNLDRRILKEAFRQARKLQTKLSLDYQL
jgi:CBS domain-containing protein